MRLVHLVSEVHDDTYPPPSPLRSFGSYDTDKVSFETRLVIDEPSLTHQSFKEECDINEIVRRFGLTGELPETPRPPLVGDFTGISDYQTALNAVLKAQEGFMEFPAELRARFAHDPQRLMDFLANKENDAEAIKLGLKLKPPEKTRDMVQAIDELAAKLQPSTKES